MKAENIANRIVHEIIGMDEDHPGWDLVPAFVTREIRAALEERDLEWCRAIGFKPKKGNDSPPPMNPEVAGSLLEQSRHQEVDEWLDRAAKELQLADVDAYDEPSVVIEKLQAHVRKLKDER